MQAAEQRLSPLDSTFLELEQASEGAMMHIGGALVFDPAQEANRAPTLEQLRALLEERLAMLPRYRCRLSEPRVHGMRRPAWIEDAAFDVAAHLRRATLPAPGGQAELHEWLGDFWSHRLDRARPLWEMVLVDGLEQGRWMLATKTHHAMVDGVGSIDVGYVLLDAEPQPGPPASVDAAPAPATGGRQLPGWLPPLVAARIARLTLDTAAHPRRFVRAGEAAVAMGEMVWRDEVNAARPSTLNVPIGTTRRFSSVRFDLDEVKAVKRALGGTVNDVILAVAAGALRRLLTQRGDNLDRPLRAMVPVDLRGATGHDELGNRVTSLFVELPVDEADALRRYERTRSAATRLKSGTAALGGSTLVLVTGLAPPMLHESISQMLFAPRLFNLTITNVPGPQITLYALGARLREILPLVPLFADHALGMAILSYDGGLVFGLNADRAVAPDLPMLEAGLREQFAALQRLARRSSART
jgi:diacylglycerol O-acyltransferase / wax synthase